MKIPVSEKKSFFHPLILTIYAQTHTTFVSNKHKQQKDQRITKQRLVPTAVSWPRRWTPTPPHRISYKKDHWVGGLCASTRMGYTISSTSVMPDPLSKPRNCNIFHSISIFFQCLGFFSRFVDFFVSSSNFCFIDHSRSFDQTNMNIMHLFDPIIPFRFFFGIFSLICFYSFHFHLFASLFFVISILDFPTD